MKVKKGVLLIGILIVLVPYLAMWLLVSRALKAPWAAVVAPLMSSLTLCAAWSGLVAVERRMAADGEAWPPVLLGLPLAGVVAGHVYALIDQAHHWMDNTLTGAAYGSIAALVGWWGVRSGRASRKPYGDRGATLDGRQPEGRLDG